MSSMATTKKAEIIEIKPVEMKNVSLTIVGDTPLIVHKWSFKALMEMLKFDSALAKKIPRNPVAEVAAALYWMDADRDPFPKLPFTMMSNGREKYREMMVKYAEYTEEDFIRDATGARFGFPATAIKKAGINTVFRSEMSKDKVSLQGTFFIDGIGEEQLVEIKSPSIPNIRQDNVKISTTSDIRYRPQFDVWSVDLSVRYNANGKLSLEDVINMINLGGQLNGIGEWRIEKGGQYGAYHVEAAK